MTTHHIQSIAVIDDETKLVVGTMGVEDILSTLCSNSYTGPVTSREDLMTKIVSEIINQGTLHT